ncbi:unnamed protein product [Brassica oleracea]
MNSIIKTSNLSDVKTFKYARRFQVIVVHIHVRIRGWHSSMGAVRQCVSL